MEKVERYCVVCGKLITKTCKNPSTLKYCSDECLNKNRAETAKKRKVARKAELENKRRQKTLSQLAVEAREAGMNYGEYVAKYGI